MLGTIGYLALLFVLAFLLGSVPWGVIVSRVFFHTDVREHGSGNIGTTNALRTMGKGGGIAVFVLDFGKGIVSGIIALELMNHFVMGDLESARAFSMALGGPSDIYQLSPYVEGIFLATAFLACTWGHIFSPWLGFKGGKGIAVAVGCLFITYGIIGACLELLIFGILVALTKYVSVGSLAAALTCPFFALYFYWGNPLAWALCTVAALTVVWAHRENIKRLRAGNENRIGSKNQQVTAGE